MLSWFQRDREVARNRPKLNWDIHAHLLPGVDDGVRTMDESLEAIRALKAAGYRGSVLTPHIYKGLYENTPEVLRPVLAEVQRAVAAAGIDYELELAAEYFADDHLSTLANNKKEPLLGFGPDKKYVLVEYSPLSEPLLWADPLSALVRNGYKPVIAHVERYRFVSDSPQKWFSNFEAFGAIFQCNIGSLVGQYGPTVVPFIRELLKRKIPTFWGSDLHRPSQVEKFIVKGHAVLLDAGVRELNRDLLYLDEQRRALTG